jgi:SAM-dependent MidA family methyltransferase
VLRDVIRERGPMTVAAFMDLALYDPSFGYYARSPRRSGAAGDFFTSVDVGRLFGELLEVQVAEMAGLLSPQGTEAIDLVEAGAGSGRLSADLLRAAHRNDPQLYQRVRLHLVEASPRARDAQLETLGDAARRLASSTASLPDRISGVVFANELLDAMPTHQVVMRESGLREVYVSINGDCHAGELAVSEGPLSTTRLAQYLERLNVRLEPGWRVEINLHAVEWIRDLARRLERGFVILIDYGHEARELYSVAHSNGTLTTFTRHTVAGPASTQERPAWLVNPGEQDITAHVDFTSIRRAAEDEGLVTLGFLDQTYFLLALADLENLENLENPENSENLKKRLAFKTLVMPGGLGSTMKVLILGKGVGQPALRGCSFAMRAT